MCRGLSVQKGLWSTLDEYGLLVHHMLVFCKTCHDVAYCSLGFGFVYGIHGLGQDVVVCVPIILSCASFNNGGGR